MNALCGWNGNLSKPPKKVNEKKRFFPKKKRIEKPKMKKMNKKTSRNPYR